MRRAGFRRGAEGDRISVSRLLERVGRTGVEPSAIVRSSPPARRPYGHPLPVSRSGGAGGAEHGCEEMHMRALIVATRNVGKLAEIRDLLEGLAVEVKGGGALPEVEETGTSFVEIAVLKARAAAEHSGAWALADDSGLEVDALGGDPGILSARYGAPAARTDAERCALLLRRLEGVPGGGRAARFRAAVAVAAPDGRIWVVEGRCEGRIATALRGSGGFGYDPLFLLPELGLTMAELPAEIKNRISHRGRALALARQVLEQEPLNL